MEGSIFAEDLVILSFLLCQLNVNCKKVVIHSSTDRDPTHPTKEFASNVYANLRDCELFFFF